MHDVVVVISTFNRKPFLENTLESLMVSSGEFDVVVLNDGSTDGTESLAHLFPKASFINFDRNRGLRFIMNHMIDNYANTYKYISYTQDDVLFRPEWLEWCLKMYSDRYAFVTCHGAPEHPTTFSFKEGDVLCLVKPTIRATHLFASSERWRRFGKIPDLTPGIASPKMGNGSKVDWWLMGHDKYAESDHSVRKDDQRCLVLAGMAVHVAFRPEHSTWSNPNQENWVVAKC